MLINLRGTKSILWYYEFLKSQISVKNKDSDMNVKTPNKMLVNLNIIKRLYFLTHTPSLFYWWDAWRCSLGIVTMPVTTRNHVKLIVPQLEFMSSCKQLCIIQPHSHSYNLLFLYACMYRVYKDLTYIFLYYSLNIYDYFSPASRSQGCQSQPHICKTCNL